MDTTIRRDRARTVRRRRSLLLAPLAVLALAPLLTAAEPAGPRFTVGEEMTYRARVPSLGTIGRGSMRIAAAEQVRGTPTYHLVFEFSGRVGLARLEDRTESWLDPRSMTSLRFRKRERSPLASRSEAVELFPAEQRWTSAQGESEGSPTAAPLDELSFLYFIRTLPLNTGETLTLRRHFDTERNPVTVQVLGREELTVPAGRFHTVLVEMRVRDPKRFGGEGVLRLHLSDDAHRTPVRISSAMPVAGRVVLDLETLERP